MLKVKTNPHHKPSPFWGGGLNTGEDVIDSFAFGSMVIDGRRYTSDLFIYPDGHVVDGWWRKKGHALTKEDIQTLLDAGCEVIIAGTGFHGRMKPEAGLREVLGKLGIQFMAYPNDQAVARFNDRPGEIALGACFHLAC